MIMSAWDILLLAGATLLWTVAGFMTFFMLVFVVIFIHDGWLSWQRKRQIKRFLAWVEQATKPTLIAPHDDFFPKIEEYRNDFSK